MKDKIQEKYKVSISQNNHFEIKVQSLCHLSITNILKVLPYDIEMIVKNNETIVAV